LRLLKTFVALNGLSCAVKKVLNNYCGRRIFGGSVLATILYVVRSTIGLLSDSYCSC